MKVQHSDNSSSLFTVCGMHQEEWEDSVPEGPDRSAWERQVSQGLGMAGAKGGGRLPRPVPPSMDRLPLGRIQPASHLQTGVSHISTRLQGTCFLCGSYLLILWTKQYKHL